MDQWEYEIIRIRYERIRRIITNYDNGLVTKDEAFMDIILAMESTVDNA